MLTYPDNKILTPIEKDIVNFCLCVWGGGKRKRDKGRKRRREGKTKREKEKERMRGYKTLTRKVFHNMGTFGSLSEVGMVVS